MTAVSKKEAQNTLNAARTKAQNAAVAKQELAIHQENIEKRIDYEAAVLHYDRCVRELEEAINDMARFETGDDE